MRLFTFPLSKSGDLNRILSLFKYSFIGCISQNKKHCLFVQMKRWVMSSENTDHYSGLQPKYVLPVVPTREFTSPGIVV